MNTNVLKLNEDKTEILIGFKHERERIEAGLGSLGLKSKDDVKNLGIILDSGLSFKSLINQVTKTCFYHLKNIARIHPFLSLNDAEKLIHAFIFSRLECYIYWLT